MAVHKFAISVPEDVMRRIDRAAARRGITRSRFISSVLAIAARAQRDAELAERVNRVFADTSLAREQREAARAFSKRLPAESWEW